MPTSSSRRRLIRPFIGPAPGITSSLKATTRSHLSVTNADYGSKSWHVPHISIDQSALRSGSDVRLPILPRVQPASRPTTSPSKTHRRGHTNSQHCCQQPGDQRRSSSGEQFALKKIRFFNAPPQPAPLTLCFSHPGYDLTHLDILSSIKTRRPIPVDKIQHIQFVDMNVLLRAGGVENRWLITLKDHDARCKLLRDGVYVDGERVFLRRYDDVNSEDYRDYLRRKNTLQSDAHTAV